jgi:hypothetical protein
MTDQRSSKILMLLPDTYAFEVRGVMLNDKEKSFKLRSGHHRGFTRPLHITDDYCILTSITANHCQSLPITASYCRLLPYIARLADLSWAWTTSSVEAGRIGS